jgi:DNA polymerase I-like protein with 3'-5' exonuclease and polymerase domains
VGGVDYGSSKNSPFQGLSADGGKLALWRLLREGSRVVLFIHDEVLIEVPDEGGFVSKEVVDRNVRIMCEEMASVLPGDIPVLCEATVSTCWSKDAQLIMQDDKVLPWSPGLERTAL